jgi:pilus assembly protein CpaB
MQNRQALLFLALAVILGLAAAFSAQRWLLRQTPRIEGKAVATVPVVMARSSVPVGAALTKGALEIAHWPEPYAPAGRLASLESAMGRVTRHPLAPGEPVLEAALLPDGSEAGLIGVIGEEKRAVSVKVDAVIGVAGFVKPGSSVDVVATLRRIDLEKKLPYSKVVLQDVRVLAIDQKLEEADNGEAHLVSVVTLEVSPEQAEHLTYISHEGRLQLALRSPGDHEVVKTRSTGVSDLLPPRRARRAIRAAGPPVQVIRGSDVSTKHF